MKLLLILTMVLALSIGTWCTATASATIWRNFPQQEYDDSNDAIFFAY